MTQRLHPPATDVEVDVRALLRSLVRALPVLLVLMALVAGGVFYLLSRMPPVYKSEVTLLIETGESDLTRPATATNDVQEPLDEQAIASQVQLIKSRDLARRVADKLKLADTPEYQKAISGKSFFTDLMAKFGLARSAASTSTEEKVLAHYYDNLQVYTVDKSRVIAVDFSSTDPKLAADGANAIATEYLAFQREAKRDTTEDATKWLESEIADLRDKVKEAEGRVADYRAQHGLFSGGGTTPVTLPEQQLADLNTELSKVRAARADAEAKAMQIRAGIDAGNVTSMADVLSSPLIQRLVEQQVALKAQIAQLSATLLPGHPRMQELQAQVRDLDRQIAGEAQKVLDSVEAGANLAKAREAEIQKNLDQLKVSAATAGDASVQLRALEREASAQRDLLDTYLRRYREALARQNGDFLPADARIISRAAVPIDPDFPKKVPMTAAAAVATLILLIAIVLIRELASGRAMREVTLAPADAPQPPPAVAAVPVVPAATPMRGHDRWPDDRGIRRMMPAEPSIAPAAMGSESERSLANIAERIIADDKRRVLVTLAEGSDGSGRPLAAVALARALAKAEKRTVLVDLRGDGADPVTMGEDHDLPGFTDLFIGEASFAQVIFRDRKSRAHFIPAGRKPMTVEALGGERLETILSALDHTYDHVVIDVGDETIPLVGRGAGAAMVVSEFGAADPRTIRAFDRITHASPAQILLLVVESAPPEDKAEGEAAAKDEAAA
jgi:exopolysaccharide transport family protein